ncbi:type I restriction enzyme HsdR N-terminal domain-containing protein [Blattabacterium cuenoti]|uniref:type I restriction enzyme HsdR N-terminal domain-containing protein n=1 Tax=Blattabacterium cuenoti TaxID=1653831 RepID=UPI00163D1294|nr:type I restriction enzyme HsdR N-terminal domain-containing protein [Blattabacterium cuenoti]
MSVFFFFINHLHLKKTKNKTYIFCMIRKKWYPFTKEEGIRQYIIFFLKKVKKCRSSNILVEVPFQINQLNKRLDILVLLKKKPYILIECKAPNILLTQKTFDQISRYNKKIKAPYLMVSNGIKNFVFQTDEHNKNFSFLNDLPIF